MTRLSANQKNWTNILTWAACLSIVFFPLTARPTPSRKGLSFLALMEKRYEKIHDFRAKFTQTSQAPGVIKKDRASGIVYLRKDGKFRWDYDFPEMVLIVSDGKTLWIYQPEDKQVMIDPYFGKKMKRFPYTFLNGMQHLHEDFNAKILEETPDTVTLELVPIRPLKEIKTMTLTFNKKTLLIQKIVWISLQEIKTVISFDDIDITSKIPDSVFHFEPPEGVDIIKSDMN